MVMQLKGIRVELALLDELVNTNMEAGSLLVIQKEISSAYKKLEESKKLNADGLAKAKKGLESAKQLGDEKTIGIFNRWVDTFSKDIARADKAIAQLKSVNIGF
jgi:DNA-binding ferritin-like protein